MNSFYLGNLCDSMTEEELDQIDTLNQWEASTLAMKTVVEMCEVATLHNNLMANYCSSVEDMKAFSVSL